MRKEKEMRSDDAFVDILLSRNTKFLLIFDRGHCLDTFARGSIPVSPKLHADDDENHDKNDDEDRKPNFPM